MVMREIEAGSSPRKPRTPDSRFGLDICLDWSRVKLFALHPSQRLTHLVLRLSFLELVMAFPLQPKHTDWKTLYRAAILETNKSVVPQRVLEAEEAVLARGREIFYGNSDLEEQEALEEALYALRAFKTAWQHTDAA